MTLFTKKALQDLEKREGEMSKRAIKIATAQEVRRRLTKVAAKNKSKAKTAEKPEPAHSY